MSIIIGKAWYNSGEYGDFISVSLNEEVEEIYPELKKLSVKLGQIPAEKRTKENSPHYNVVLSVKDKNKKEEF